MCMTKEELKAVRRERGKQVLNIGDKVKAYGCDGDILYSGKVFEITGKGPWDGKTLYGLDGLNRPFFAEDLELMREPTDEISPDDIVNEEGRGQCIPHFVRNTMPVKADYGDDE